MKLSPILTKIAAFLLVSAKAVNGVCIAPPDLVYFGLGDIYCDLYKSNPKQAILFELVVTTSFQFDPSGNFLQTCLTDLLTATKMGESGIIRQNCEEGKTEIVIFTEIETSFYSNNTLNGNWTVRDGMVEADLLWEAPMCKSASCDADVLQKVLTTTFIDFLALYNTGWKAKDWKAISTVTPTAECVWKQISDPVLNPELYCTADAPTCSNIKLAEITIADDAPFEVAICDDNDCLASVGAIDIVGFHATGPFIQTYTPTELGSYLDPYCIADLEYWHTNRHQKYVSAKILDKAFDKTNYCTAAAANGRMGRCRTCSDSDAYEFKVKFSGKMEKCSWMSKHPNAKRDAKRINKNCADIQTKFQCAKTCSNCRSLPCVDDPRYMFDLPEVGKSVNCKYITKNYKKTAKRKEKLCPLTGAFCPKSCGYCKD